MKKEQCPICYTELEEIECAPCYDCGHLPEEIEHFKSGKHTYTIYDVYRGLKLQLCNFCDVDFGSYNPEYFGIGKKLDLGGFTFVQESQNPKLEKDKYCPECERRLKFLTFLKEIRELGEKAKQS